MRVVVIVLVVIMALGFMAFATYNASERVDVSKRPFADGVFKSVALPEVVLWSFMAGVFLSMLVFLLVYLRQSVQLRAARRRIRSLEGEVTVLRNRPIEESADLLKGADEKAQKASSPFERDKNV